MSSILLEAPERVERPVVEVGTVIEVPAAEYICPVTGTTTCTNDPDQQATCTAC